MRRLPSIGPLVGALLAFALVAVAAPAGAHPESAAPSLRPDVLRAGHLPDPVAPHTQWQGFLDLRPDSNVTAAYYQVCRVGQSCFAPPAPADEVGDKSFRFDTSGYLANGRPVDYQPGWRLGVTWLLEERLPNGTTQAVRFPVGPDVLSPGCQGAAALSCAEAHYLAFDLPAEERSSSAMPLPASLLALALVAMHSALRRRQP